MPLQNLAVARSRATPTTSAPSRENAAVTMENGTLVGGGYHVFQVTEILPSESFVVTANR